MKVGRDVASAELLIAMLSGVVRRRNEPISDAELDFHFTLMDSAAGLLQMFVDKELIEQSWKAEE